MPRAQAAASTTNPPIVEELHFKSDSAFLCLLLNRRTEFIRVIDFRSGALPAKRLFIQSVAKRERVRKVITLVEKDEVSSWTRVGFVREGTIPGFYKRSDGHLCGCVINERTASLEISDDGAKRADRTVNHGKKNAREVPAELKMVTVKEIGEAGRAQGARQPLQEGHRSQPVRRVRARRQAHVLRVDGQARQDELPVGRVPGLLRSLPRRGLARPRGRPRRARGDLGPALESARR